jgi:hypothetical protein
MFQVKTAPANAKQPAIAAKQRITKEISCVSMQYSLPQSTILIQRLAEGHLKTKLAVV